MIVSPNNLSTFYCRVSSKEQEETGYSLTSQEKLLTEYANRKNFEITKIFSIAESASGAKRRAVFSQMMDYITKNNVKNLVVEKVDRLTRNLKEAVVINDWVDGDPERKIHFVKQNLIIHKNAKSDEKFRWDIEIVLAKKYIANLSEEVKKGQAEKLAQGWLPTKPPIGYKTIGDKGHKIHVVDQEKAPYIKKAFELYASGNHSMESIRKILENEGLHSRSGKKLSKSRVEDILNEPFYYGALRWNGVFHKEGRHEPIISKELFDKAQEVRKGYYAPKKSKHNFCLKKMMKCGECGSTITPEIQKGIIYYHCSRRGNGCNQKEYSTEDTLNNQLREVFSLLKNITSNEAELIKAKIKQNHAEEIAYKETTLKSLNSRYIQLQSRLDILYNDRLDQKITPEFWEKKQAEVNDEQKAIQEQIAKIKNEETRYFEIWLNILDLANRAEEIYSNKNRTPEEKRLLLRHFYSDMKLKDKQITKTIKKPIMVISERVKSKLEREKLSEPKKSLDIKGQKTLSGGLCPELLHE